MLASLLGRLFGCPHGRMSRPITLISKPGAPGATTYVVCLDCGRQFAYDWDAMRTGKPIDQPAPHAGMM
jgi:hypothetical protein